MIYRALPPSNKVDPFGVAAQHQRMVTNLRVRLLQRQPCPCQTKQPGAAALPTRHYAIYDFVVKGSCLCHGHADRCGPARGSKPSPEKTNSMVSDCPPGRRFNVHGFTGEVVAVAPSAACTQRCAATCTYPHSFTHHYRDLRLWKALIKVLGLML